MRAVTEYVTKTGEKRHRVRFRQGQTQTSETFRRKQDANTFAALLASAPGDAGVNEALAWLASKRTASDAPTFGDFFETYVEQLTGVTARTRADYRAQYRRYLTHLGATPLHLISRAHVTDVVNTLDRKGRSPKTIKNVIHMLSSCLALALYEGHIARNPCTRVRLPKARLEQAQARFLTADEFAALYAAMPEHYRPLLAFMVGTGLRWSEVTALQARHVDLAAGTVRVEQAWKETGGRELGPPKSLRSRRTVNAAVLALAAVKPLLGKPRDFVFTTPTGRVVRHSNFYNRIWGPACREAGLDPAPRIHDLRHTHASWLISDGQPLEAVQDQLGHESILTTRSVYAHLLPALGVAVGRSASAALERALVDAPQLAARAVVAVEHAGHADQAADA